MKKIAIAASCLIFSAGVAAAEDAVYSVGVHASALLGDGRPSNDIIGLGFSLAREFDQEWFASLEYIQSDADFERPWKVVGLVQDGSVSTIDAKYSSDLIMFHGGKKYPMSAQTSWYWAAGIGMNDIQVKNASGPVQGGGNFNLVTSVSNETVVGAKLGLEQDFAEDWSMHYALRADQHLASWKVRDTLGTSTGEVGNYTTWGVNIGVVKEF